MIRWAVQWRSDSQQLDGPRRHFMGDGTPRPLLFRTRRECLLYIRDRWGYIADRSDLRREPHCWRMPRAVRVRVTIEEYQEADAAGLYHDRAGVTEPAIVPGMSRRIPRKRKEDPMT